MKMSDPTFAMGVRDLIARVAKTVVGEVHPPARYGVESYDRVNYTCRVLFTGSTEAVTVNMGCVQPSTTGQKVRVSPVQGDFFLESVIGPAYIAEGSES